MSYFSSSCSSSIVPLSFVTWCLIFLASWSWLDFLSYNSFLKASCWARVIWRASCYIVILSSEPATMPLIKNFRSQRRQIVPRLSTHLPLLSSSIPTSSSSRKGRVFFMHYLQLDAPQKSQWLPYRSELFFHFSPQVLHPSGVLWYLLGSIAFFNEKIISESLKVYSRSPMKKRFETSRISSNFSFGWPPVTLSSTGWLVSV